MLPNATSFNAPSISLSKFKKKKKMLLEFQIGLVSELWPMIGLSMNYALLTVTLKVLMENRPAAHAPAIGEASCAVCKLYSLFACS